jgi:hypothetical protein
MAMPGSLMFMCSAYAAGVPPYAGPGDAFTADGCCRPPVGCPPPTGRARPSEAVGPAARRRTQVGGRMGPICGEMLRLGFVVSLWNRFSGPRGGPACEAGAV